MQHIFFCKGVMPTIKYHKRGSLVVDVSIIFTLINVHRKLYTYMKKIVLFLFLLCSMATARVAAQCAIYADRTIATWANGYNSDGSPTSMTKCMDYAKRKCTEAGGTNCTLLYKSTKAGWWGFINGMQGTTRSYLTVGDGYSSKYEAETKLREKYRSNGGREPETVQVHTWYVYSNPTD